MRMCSSICKKLKEEKHELPYPNPTTGTAKLDLTALPAGRYPVRIVGTLGKTMRHQPLTGGQVHELRLAELPAGVYMVQVQAPQLLT